MKTIIAQENLDMDAITLGDFISNNITFSKSNEAPLVVYVKDDKGRTFGKVSLVRETLSDGSEVFDLVLSD